MDLKEILAITPETVANNQHAALKKHVLSVLDNVRKIIEEEDYEKISKVIFYSPAGDDMGLDSSCIDFSWESDQIVDIEDVCNKLNNLKELMQKSS